jgi:hypothetical protein
LAVSTGLEPATMFNLETMPIKLLVEVGGFEPPQRR